MIRETKFEDCFQIDLPFSEDIRGNFLKTYHFSTFSDLGLEFQCKEEFVTTSTQNVIRGMHFQTPPHDHKKLVYCLAGRVRDVVLDIRKNSATYGQFEVFELDANIPTGVYISEGYAHGFLAMSDEATMLYRVSAEHAPSCDAGIRWDSFGYEWGVINPVVSDRDQSHISFDDFKSPF